MLCGSVFVAVVLIGKWRVWNYDGAILRCRSSVRREVRLQNIIVIQRSTFSRLFCWVTIVAGNIADVSKL